MRKKSPQRDVSVQRAFIRSALSPHCSECTHRWRGCRSFCWDCRGVKQLRCSREPTIPTHTWLRMALTLWPDPEHHSEHFFYQYFIWFTTCQQTVKKNAHRHGNKIWATFCHAHRFLDHILQDERRSEIRTTQKKLTF